MKANFYQTWLGTINGLRTLDVVRLESAGGFQGRILGAGTETESAGGGEAFSFLCTNSAPVGKVDTDYSTFPTVRTPVIEGVAFEGLRDHMAYRFLGIPSSAKPPVDDLRFQYAQPPGYRNGSVVVMQPVTGGMHASRQFRGQADGLNPWGNSEDCLHLQVFTQLCLLLCRRPRLRGFAVMLWIHGGAMINGAGSDSTFDGASLASRGDVVLAAINYRLNIRTFKSKRRRRKW